MRDAVVTALLWIAYLALARVAIEGVFDLLRGRITSLEGARVRAVMPTLIEYGVFIAINGTTLIGWALYNYFRFRGPDRRLAVAPVSPEDVAGHFGVDAALARRMTEARIGVLHHDSQGRITGFEPVATPAGGRGESAPDRPPAD